MIGSMHAQAAVPSPVVDLSNGRELNLLGQSLTVAYLASSNPRFDDFVRQDLLGCHDWTGATDPDGYGKFHLGKGVVLAHRFAYERTRGFIPDGMQVDHICTRPSCANPIHLQLVTPQQNVALARIRAGKPSAYGRQDALNDGLAVDLADLLYYEDGSSSIAWEASVWEPPVVRAAWNQADEGWGDPRFHN
jgi:hypothetical protein